MLIVAILLLVLNIILMFIFYRKVSRNFSQNVYKDRMAEEVNRLIIDIEHESDRAITLLEDKMQRIEKLLADTDKHLLLIEKEQEKWVYQKEVMASARDSIESKRNISSEKAVLPSAKSDSITIYTKPVMPQSDLLKVMTGLSPREQVIELAKKGFSLDFIAEKVALPVGEIELILSLNT